MLNSESWPFEKQTTRALKVTIYILIIVAAVFVANGASFSSLLSISQRSLLFYVALPTWRESGRIMTGLGYVSSSSYGNNLTPYTTYFLDNSYIYYLVTTGIIGFLLIGIAVYVLGRNIYKNRFKEIGMYGFSLFCVYLYISLFEAVVFNSGIPTNYIYMVLLLSVAGMRENDVIDTLEEDNVANEK